MSLNVTYQSYLTTIETFAGVFVGSTDNTITVNGLNTITGLTGSTTPAVTKYSAFEKTLSAGSGTIDLTSLPDEQGTAAAVTLDGLKVQVIKLKNKSTNANNITIAKGASNGYTGFGSAFSVVLPPGAELTLYGNDGNGAVGSGSKTLDLTGTGSQVLQVHVIAG